MARFGLVGPSYQSQSPVADPEECINWYVETMEANGKSAQMLYPSPGLSLFCSLAAYGLAASSVRGQIFTTFPGIVPSTGRMFAVGGSTLYEVFANGTFNPIGNRGSGNQVGFVGTDGAPVSMAASPQQLAIASAGNLYVLNFATGNLVTVSPNSFPSGAVAKVDYADGFFIVNTRNSNTWQVSNLYDATTWPPLATTGLTNVFPENVVSMIVDHRYVWVFGQKKSQVYQNVGANIFPYAAIPGALIENGSVAQNSVAKLDNSIFWLGGDERGAGIVWRTSGYSGVRVSNFALEYAIQSYQAKGITISDAVGWGTQENGHTFYYLYFPTANVTWVYDVATQFWHKRLYWDSTGYQAKYTAHRAQCHAFAFGQHLVGDWNSGNIYVQSLANLTDNGAPLRRERIAPSISSENTRIYHAQLQIDAETGLGPQPPLLDGTRKPRGPQLAVSWSDDGAHTWSNDRIIDCGQAGAFRTRAMLRRLGQSRNRNYRIVATDPIPWRIIDAYVLASPGFQVPSERIVKQYGKVA